jgi:hypothetical protein
LSVGEILLSFSSCNDWEKALEELIPKRKGAVLKAESADSHDAHEQDEEQDEAAAEELTAEPVDPSAAPPTSGISDSASHS